ncbi:MAG: peptidogalycan biosysnthesis protein, partial [Burkholderiaceae bacterium]
MSVNNYVTRVIEDPAGIAQDHWDSLLTACNQHGQSANGTLNPFVRHAYLAAMHSSASAVTQTGWQAYFVSLWDTSQAQEQLVGVCPMYIKAHSYGEYVFDFAWARAYQEHGLAYYPKAVIAP